MGRILVVDDDIGVRKAMIDRFKERYDVTSAGNEQEATEIIGKCPPFDLVITDLRMTKDEGGIDVLEAAKKKDSLTTEVIIITAHGSLGNVHRAMEFDVWTYIDKTMKNAWDMLEIDVKRVLASKKLKAELIQTEKLARVGTLLFTVAHQLKNPLNNISLSVSSLNRLIPDKSLEVKEKIKNIEREIDRSSKIIKNFVDFARPSGVDRREEDINLILEQTLNLVKDSALFKDIEIKTGVNSSLPKIVVDADQIKEVFLNIVLNAQEAMPKGGALKVTTDFIPDEKEVAIIFADTGCGISPEKIKDVFNSFYTTKQRGMGLGLSIAQRIIQEHKGTIEVESVVEKGTTFNIRLPI